MKRVESSQYLKCELFSDFINCLNDNLSKVVNINNWLKDIHNFIFIKGTINLRIISLIKLIYLFSFSFAYNYF